MIELNAAFIIQIINFCILAFVLNTFLFKPLRRVLSDRRQTLDSSRLRTESVDRDVREKMALYESRLRDAKAEAALLRTATLKQAQSEETALLEQARLDASVTLSGIRDSIARESADARQLLKQHAQSLSDDICHKILGRSL